MVGRHDLRSPFHREVERVEGSKSISEQAKRVLHIEQVHEVQEAGSLRVHLFNPWNVVEATKLASLSTAFFFRMHAWVSC